jgi:hypothetical protein
MEINGALDRARWEVLWIAGGTLKRKGFGSDFASALQFYTIATRRDAGATEYPAIDTSARVTLRCCNMGHPPAERYRPQTVKVARKGARTVKLKADQKAPKGWQEGTVILTPMKKLNAEGKWWCAYCLRILPFQLKKGFHYEGRWIDNRHMACPLCGVTHRDHHIKKWNPVAQRIFAGEAK